ncbi:type II secretion system F family protein [Thaumasiovibrio subtropicus]|uniref:type II secretion system F family protein n=1 Tax=Thaumasiovibrio subtropicus TaxID=1891207 RepID=UPI000B357E61|nr:type II secretion system F family protein [Thaumasiovibrio subtropicus]
MSQYEWMRIGFALLVALGLVAMLAVLIRRSSAHEWLKHFEMQSQNKQPWHARIQQGLQRYFSYRSKEIKEKFIKAGYYEGTYAWFYLPAKIISSILLFVFGFIFPTFVGLEDFSQQVMFVALGLVIVIVLPDMVLESRKNKLTRRISNQLPYLLDLMAVCVQTGMTIEAAISYIAIEMKDFDRDLSHLLKTTDDRARVVGLNRALDELLHRVPSNEMRSFVFTLTQSLQYGSSVYGVLTTLAKDIREVQILQLEENVGKLSSKMSVPLILFIMFPIVVLIAAPGVMRMMG